MAADIAELAHKLAPGFPGKAVAWIGNVSQEENLGLRFTLADVTVWYTRGSKDKERRYDATQTAAQYDSPNHRFPEFALQPSGGLTDLMARMSGFNDIDFASHPAFSKAYLLTGTSAPAVRRLFEHAPLLDMLGRRTGLTVHSQLSGLVIHRWELRCDDAQRKAFAAESAVLFNLFEDAAAAAREKPAPKVDLEAFFASLPGPQGRDLRKRAVLRADLAALLAQPVPRKPGWKVFSAAAGAGVFFLLLGAAFASGGTVFAAMYAAGGNFTDAVLPLVLAAGGLAGLVHGLLEVTRARRLLRHGTRAQARIESVEPTGRRTDDAPDYRLRVRFQAGAESVESACTVNGAGALRARMLKEDGKAVTVLYDPAKPTAILFVEGLLTLSPEIEP